MNDKILPIHLERRAAVYLRQSTLKQVLDHRESTTRQYALKTRALDLGWAADRIDVVDEDLGQSGRSTDRRTGFQRLAEDVAHGRVGAIFALEVSRLSRSSADWHRLLDLCRVAEVIIVDEQAVYDPNDNNDRLLLGFKGTMNEAEQEWMRLRLQGGKLSKARRGDLYVNAPTGYVWDDASCRLRLDPDEQVQRVVRLIFDRFRLDGSALAVFRYLARQGLRLPCRTTREGLRWILPHPSLILRVLHNPVYTGAYVVGRYRNKACLVDGQIRHRVVLQPQDAWKVCIRDHHPAYVTWEEYMANQRKLIENQHAKQGVKRGAAREGRALLQGLGLCGVCGNRLQVTYGAAQRPHYVCRNRYRDAVVGSRDCFNVPARSIDAAVEQLFLEVVHPPEIELGLAVVREAERQGGEVDRLWKLRLDRAQYDAQLAERRYKAVDPDNRVVARTLEREWNDKLREVEEIQREQTELRRREKIELTDADRARILSLAKDLPRVWNAKTTTFAERKNLLQMLVERVTLSPVEVPQRMTRVQLLWQTGAVADFTVARPGKGLSTVTPPEAVDLIRTLAASHMLDREIVAELQRRGLRTGMNCPWSIFNVHYVRQSLGIPSGSVGAIPDRRADGRYSVAGVAKRLGVTSHIVRHWIERGLLPATKGGGGPMRAWWCKLDAATMKRLEAAKARGYGPGGRTRSPKVREATAAGAASAKASPRGGRKR